jgi:hypothetical protein
MSARPRRSSQWLTCSQTKRIDGCSVNLAQRVDLPTSAREQPLRLRRGQRLQDDGRRRVGVSPDGLLLTTCAAHAAHVVSAEPGQ